MPDTQSAHSYQFFQCENPACTVHICLLDRFGHAFGEATFNDRQAREIIAFLQSVLYAKAADNPE